MLDADYIERAAPPGSMRYFALLYAPADLRDAFAAMLVVDSEIRASTHAAHEVAHTRLQWWRGEIDRLINRNAQHPATQTLQAALPAADFARLHEVLVAADMDLAGMTYNTASELDAYMERSGGIFAALSEPNLAIRRAGALIRRVETLRDLTTDARGGRIYWPVEQLDSHSITVEQLRSPSTHDSIRTLLRTETLKLLSEAETLRVPIRPLQVLVDLHVRLLQRIERSNFDVASQRHELGALQKIWTAWRAARRA